MRAAVICVDAGELLCVRLRDPVSGVERLFPPGGRIEPGESPAQAAVREALEETGHAVRLVPGVERVERYPYTWAGVPRDVTTHFFGAVLAAGRAAQGLAEHDALHRGVTWLPCAAIAQKLAYDDIIRGAVLALVTALTARADADTEGNP